MSGRSARLMSVEGGGGTCLWRDLALKLHIYGRGGEEIEAPKLEGRGGRKGERALLLVHARCL